MSLKLPKQPTMGPTFRGGSPFLTVSVTKPTPLSISTIHAILSFSSNDNLTKFTFHLNNDQAWILYASLPIKLSHELSEITSEAFSSIIRIALFPDFNSKNEDILDKYTQFLLPSVSDYKYKSIDGELVGVVGDSWLLKTDSVSVTWHTSKGVKEESHDKIVSALSKDVEGLKSSPITTTSSYFYGKLIARAARLALITEEVNYLDAIPIVKKYLKESIEPWLDGTFNGNGFLYDKKWGGIITKQGSTDTGADFGFGIYNDHHYHLGYFLYGIAL
ncbi:probable endo-1,3(4)-beta-glucanase ARB_01444 [Medicago truncatula]|uniref:probable endo-1,3(4)-beta-glucanase ARB_01444 n=1 Tax=Medicago truncatula TaxID=3880 RepID=UPI000D2F2517|nr:probable endo-1,3(4)-beta-glucanase ARB_01444 [Medicago truncatula]